MTTKRITQGLSMQPEMMENVRKRAGNRGFSSYVVGLIERDLSGTLSTQSDTPIEELARVFHPTITPELKKLLGDHNQGRIIARFLEALSIALARNDFNPEDIFSLYGRREHIRAIPGLEDFLHALSITKLDTEDEEDHAIASMESKTAKLAKKIAANVNPASAVIDALNAIANPQPHKSTPTPPRPRRAASE